MLSGDTLGHYTIVSLLRDDTLKSSSRVCGMRGILEQCSLVAGEVPPITNWVRERLIL